MPVAAFIVNLRRVSRWPCWRTSCAIMLLVGLALTGVVYRYAEDAAIERLRLAGAQRLDTYATGLENLLSKYDFLPGTFECPVRRMFHRP